MPLPPILQSIGRGFRISDLSRATKQARMVKRMGPQKPLHRDLDGGPQHQAPDPGLEDYRIRCYIRQRDAQVFKFSDPETQARHDYLIGWLEATRHLSECERFVPADPVTEPYGDTDVLDCGSPFRTTPEGDALMGTGAGGGLRIESRANFIAVGTPPVRGRDARNRFTLDP